MSEMFGQTAWVKFLFKKNIGKSKVDKRCIMLLRFKITFCRWKLCCLPYIHFLLVQYIDDETGGKMCQFSLFKLPFLCDDTYFPTKCASIRSIVERENKRIKIKKSTKLFQFGKEFLYINCKNRNLAQKIKSNFKTKLDIYL